MCLIEDGGEIQEEGEEPGEETAMLSESQGSSHQSNTAKSVHSQQSAQSAHSASEDNSKNGMQY